MMPVAILAGGKGTRLSPLTDHVPKSLVDVGGKPFLVRQIELLKRHGYTDIVLLINHLGCQIRAAIGDGAGLGVRVRYSEDGPDLKERDDAIWQSPAWTDARACFVLYGDSYLECDYADLERQFLADDYVTMLTHYKGVDYGLRAFRYGAWRASRQLFIDMPNPWEEIGSFDGLERVRALFKDDDGR